MSSNCIPHTGKPTVYGYGQVKRNGKNYRAHRDAFVQANGLTHEAIKGKVVRHTCDNPICVNPDHLLLGTQAENMQDKVDRDRCVTHRGEDNTNAKLTAEQVAAIRAEYVPHKVSQYALAKKYGVSRSAIYLVLSGTNWSTV